MEIETDKLFPDRKRRFHFRRPFFTLGIFDVILLCVSFSLVMFTLNVSLSLRKQIARLNFSVCLFLYDYTVDILTAQRERERERERFHLDPCVIQIYMRTHSLYLHMYCLCTSPHQRGKKRLFFIIMAYLMAVFAFRSVHYWIVSQVFNFVHISLTQHNITGEEIKRLTRNEKIDGDEEEKKHT